MIDGASQADCGVLVVNTVRGEYETGLERGGQTREHARLLRAMGVFELIVACNKMDDGGWSRDRYEEIVASMSDFLAQCGYKVEAKVTFVPTSGQSDPPQLRTEPSRRAVTVTLSAVSGPQALPPPT